MGCRPKFVGNAYRLDAELRPPSHFIAGPMQVAMMRAAERHREFIADLEAKASRLREAQVMGVRRLAPANDAGLRGDKLRGDACHAAAAFSASPHNLQNPALVLLAGKGTQPSQQGSPQLSEAARNSIVGPSVCAADALAAPRQSDRRPARA